ncbi:MAG: hypothetical protein AB1Z98_07570 [Nannocystaceae bacterium]
MAHRINVLLMASVALGSSGCARDLARSSSGAIGCPPDAIDVSEISVGWSEMSWTARCRDTTFYCSGESGPSCTPAPEAIAETTPAPSTPGPKPSPPSAATTNGERR